MTVTLAKWSIAEYHQMIASGVLIDRRVELLNGEIVEMPSEGVDHAYYNTKGRKAFERLLADRATVRDAKPITLPDQASEPAPDIAIVEAPDELYSNHHPYPSNIYLLVEYAYSSLAKDTELKRQLYAKAGIPEYWVINLRDQRLMVYRDPQDGDYQSAQTIANGSIALLAFPDVTIDLNQLL